ncbi:butyrophilin-like protein 2 [Oreochromis niloticus]|uniref:butyrophilin-like protein 2 n=1 Tax=Oreochromis niloticus TaxID=8128 RepID=UPI000DF41EF6|nr:butyrophilin-like protein 2 [Oreochromis niloticus]
MFLLFLLLMNVSQHALAVEVEGNTEAESVQLPCQHSGFIPEDNPTVTWTRNDLDPTTVHLRREEGDDLKGQNQRYRGRTSMRPDALDSLDFSLTLRKPQLTDSSNYTCSISNGREERQLTAVQLKVKADREEVNPGVKFVQLPCNTTLHLAEDAKVEWMDSGDHRIHVFQNGLDQPVGQSKDYRGRTEMYANLVKTGDLSLFLERPTEKDTNIYTCTVYSREGNILLMKQVKLYVRDYTSSNIIVTTMVSFTVVFIISIFVAYYLGLRQGRW